MLIKCFISHQWKQATRSPIFQKNLAVNIFLGFIVLILVLEALVVGIYLGDKWHELFPNDHPVTKFNSYLLYYFAFDLILRFMLQNLPVMKVQPYLHLPIRKGTIVHYLLSKALLSGFNFLPLFIFIPMAIFQVAGNYSENRAWVWILSVFFLILTNNYLMVYLKKQLVSKPSVVGVFGLFFLALTLLDRFGVFTFSTYSAQLFDSFILNPEYLLVPIFLFILFYVINFRFLKRNMYPEEISVRKSKKIDSISGIRYLKSLGMTGELLSLDMRLFWRHKRTKSTVIMLTFFVLYGLIIYPNEAYNEMFWVKIVASFVMIGGLMYSYLSYAFAWESSYFDALLAHNIDMHMYFRMKFRTSIIICTVFYILTTPYVYFGYDVLFVNTSMYLYNIGFLSFASLYLATYNKKRVDLGGNAFFNYQGMGASNWLAILPAMIIPIILYQIFNAFGLHNFGIAINGIIGIIGLMFSKSIMDKLVKQFDKRKYVMAEGFRKK